MLIVHLFVSYPRVNLCYFFSSTWCQGLAATSVCGYSWAFLFTFFNKYLENINVLYEEQAGFRNHYSATDHIFNLKCLIDLPIDKAANNVVVV